MGMTIDIDGSIKELSKWRNDLNYDNGDYCYGDDTTRHSLDVAIETMRKYQKIEKIANDKNINGDYLKVLEIRMVLEDGNDD